MAIENDETLRVDYIAPRGTARGPCLYCGQIWGVEGLKQHVKGLTRDPTKPRCRKMERGPSKNVKENAVASLEEEEQQEEGSSSE